MRRLEIIRHVDCWRAVAGMGGSGLTNGALTIITASVPLKRMPALLEGLMSVAQLGTVLGPMVGGALTQYSTWRWCKPSFSLLHLALPDRSRRLLRQLARGSSGGDSAPGHPHPRSSSEGRQEVHAQTNLTKLGLFGATLFASTTVIFLLALQWGGQAYRWNSAVSSSEPLATCVYSLHGRATKAALQ